MVPLHFCPTERFSRDVFHQQLFSWYQVVDLSTPKLAAAARLRVQRPGSRRGCLLLASVLPPLARRSGALPRTGNMLRIIAQER